MFDLTGKNAIITGSSKGIGKSIAAAMATGLAIAKSPQDQNTFKFKMDTVRN